MMHDILRALVLGHKRGSSAFLAEPVLDFWLLLFSAAGPRYNEADNSDESMLCKRKISESLEKWTEQKRRCQIITEHLHATYSSSPDIESGPPASSSIQNMDLEIEFDNNYLDHQFWKISPDEYINCLENTMTWYMTTNDGQLEDGTECFL